MYAHTLTFYISQAKSNWFHAKENLNSCDKDINCVGDLRTTLFSDSGKSEMSKFQTEKSEFRESVYTVTGTRGK